MSFNLYVYAPTEGVEYLMLYSAAITGQSALTLYPQGTGTPCYTNTAVADGAVIAIAAQFIDGYRLVNYVVNEDGAISYGEIMDGIAVRYEHTGASNVYIRAEVEKIPTYYATLAFNANGGTGAPDSINGSTVGSSTVTFTIPTTKPTRSGYVFTGWLLNWDGGSSVYQAGGTANVEGGTSGITYTLYAMWEIADGGLRIYNGDWGSGAAYIWNGTTWKKAIPYVWDGEWKKGV